jgi:hypothetical protein
VDVGGERILLAIIRSIMEVLKMLEILKNANL